MKKIIEFQRVRYWQFYNEVSNSALAAQNIVDGYNSIPTFENLNDKDWPEFCKNPQAYFDTQIEALKNKRFGDDPIDMDVFRQLYRIPNIRFTDSSLNNSEYLTMKNGSIILDKPTLEQMKQDFTVTTDDPVLIKKLEKIEKLVKQYDTLYNELFQIKSGRHDFKEIGYNRQTGEFLNEVVVKFVK